MKAVFNTDSEGIAAARARILKNRGPVISIPVKHSDEEDSDFDSHDDDDADCFVE